MNLLAILIFGVVLLFLYVFVRLIFYSLTYQVRINKENAEYFRDTQQINRIDKELEQYE